MGLRERFPRRPRVPAEVSRHLGLDRGERVLAVAHLDDSTLAVATGRRLLVGDRAGLRESVEWYEVDRGAWESEGRTLDVRLVDGRRVLLEMAGDTRTGLPETLRDRVQSSVVVSRTVDVGPRGVRVVVRRAPEGFVSQVIRDPQVSLDDPDVARRVDDVRRELEASVGLTGD